MTGLLHIDVQPNVVMKPGRRSAAASGMEAHQHSVIVFAPRNADGDAFRHTAPNIFHSVGRPVAPEYPDHSLPAKSLAQELSVGERIRSGEHSVFRRARILNYPATPGRKSPTYNP